MKCISLRKWETLFLWMSYLNQGNFLIMKINELRAGNHMTITEKKAIKFDTWMFDGIYKSLYKGIPIDEDFCKENEDLFKIGEKFWVAVWFDTIKNKYVVDITAEVQGNTMSHYLLLEHIKFVDQLENLIYDLTGEMPEFTFDYLNK